MSKATEYLEKMRELEAQKKEAIDELLSERESIDSALKELGYTPPKKTRKPRVKDPNAPQKPRGRPKRAKAGE